MRGKDISGGMNIPYVELDKTSISSIMVGGAVMAKLGDSKKPAIVRVVTAKGRMRFMNFARATVGRSSLELNLTK